MGLPNEIHPFSLGGNDVNTFKVANSLRFRASATAYLNRTPASAGDRQKWTWSGWVKRGALGTAQYFFCAVSGTTECNVSFQSNNVIYFLVYNSATTAGQITTSAVFRDPSAWYHVVAVLDTNNATSTDRMRLYVNGVRQSDNGTGVNPGSGVTGIVNSNVPHYSGTYNGSIYAVDGYLAEVNFIDGQALTPSSFGYTDNLTNQWMPKQYTGTYGTNGFYLPFNDNSTATSENKATYSEQFDDASWAKPAAPVAPTVTANAIAAPNGTTTADRINYSGATTHPVYKEYSFTVANGSTVTTSMYLKNYIAGTYLLQCFINTPGSLDAYTSITFDSNGVITSYGPAGGDAANVLSEIYDVGNGWYRVVCRHTNNSGSSQGSTRISIGLSNSGVSGIYVWGAQMELSSTVGPYFATVGSAGVSTYRIGRDASNGNASWNNWYGTGIGLFSPANTATTTHDSYIDSPTSYDDGGNGRGNYATWNPLNAVQSTLGQGNLRSEATGSSTDVITTFPTSTTGKWYAEIGINATPNIYWPIRIGAADRIGAIGGAGSTYCLLYTDWSGFGIYKSLNGSTSTVTPSGSFPADGDILKIAYDADAGKLWLGLNSGWYGTTGSVTGDPATGTDATLSGATNKNIYPNHNNAGGPARVMFLNCGQRPFSYTPPAGFKALNSYNLANPSLPLV